MPFTLKSAAFRSLDPIPKQYTCEGADRAPPLDWKDPPRGTKSFAVIVEDIDAPTPAAPVKAPFTHWVLYGVPATVKSLTEVAPLPPGARQGKNDFNRPGYSGPCKPKEKHRIMFRLFALDVVLEDLKNPTRSKLEAAMKGHVLGKAEMMGTADKSRKT